MTISLEEVRRCLLKENLLKELVTADEWTLTLPTACQTVTFDNLSYDSRKVSPTTLFFCKGLTFKADYLAVAIEQGLGFYVAEEPYDVPAKLGIIVTDVRKAMAILSMAFYDYPQTKLQMIGFTGTKGKTTAAYFTKYILDQNPAHRVAMLSTMNSTLDGQTYFKSQLTTPESMDLYRMMATAVENKMTHFIMEVSSQAYKVNRVYGLHFDIGIFLNISLDHISPIEHPTFDDYFYCKRQLIAHADTVILNYDADYFSFLYQFSQLLGKKVLVYGQTAAEQVDYVFQPDEKDVLAFAVQSQQDSLHLAGDYRLRLGGDFNKGNALSAAIASALTGAVPSDCQAGIAATTVPGRMESLTHANGAKVYVDYAHNYDSLKNLLTFVKQQHPAGRLIVVIGSTGKKALSRRQAFGQVLSELADVAVLTMDDPADEEPLAISQEIATHISTPIAIEMITDRQQAIEYALTLSAPEDAIVLAGKGADLFQKIGTEDVPYAGDYAIAEAFIAKNEA